MVNCPGSPWLRRANRYLQNSSNHGSVEWHTIDYLINNNRIGIQNRTGIKNIIDHLNNRGLVLSREIFQHGALGNLKRRKIVVTLIYPSSKGGVFIPCNVSEVKAVAKQILERVKSETQNLESIIRGTSIPNITPPLITEIDNAIRQI